MATTALIPKDELERTSKSVVALQEQAASLTIESPDDVQRATYLLQTIKEYKNALTSRKEEITRPAMKALASIRDLFKGPELAVAGAEKSVKDKMLAYHTIEAHKVEEAKERVENMVEKGTMRPDTAVEKFAGLKTTKMKTRTVTKVRVFDATLIPREWLMPNMPLITEAVLKQGKEILGVVKTEEKIVVN